MRLIDAESLKELFPDNGEGSWTYNATVKAYIDALPSVQPDTTTHDSIPAETGKNGDDKPSGDCISRTQAIDAFRDYLVGKRCPDDGTLTCRLIENEVINKLPSIQPDIIRCKDCKHHWTHRCMDGMPTERCDLEQTFYDANIDYCSLAERKEVTE